MSTTLSDNHQYLSPDDSISLSLEYYQQHLDRNDEIDDNRSHLEKKEEVTLEEVKKSTESTKLTKQISDGDEQSLLNPSDNASHHRCTDPNSNDVDDCNSNGDGSDALKTNDDDKKDVLIKNEERTNDRRYLQCPAAVSMSHLQKFLRMKYALSTEHKVSGFFLYNLGVLQINLERYIIF